MLSLLTKISLIALWTIMTGITILHALPGGGLDLAAATEINLESRSGYIGMCYDTNKCDEGNGQGTPHQIEGDGKANVGLKAPCDTFLPAIANGYACTVGCGLGSRGGCSALTKDKCMKAGPYKSYCVSG